MIGSMILSLAMCGQAAPNPDAVASPEKQKALLAAIQAKAAAPKVKAMTAAEKERQRRIFEEMRARYAANRASLPSKTAGYRAHNAQVAREVAAQARMQQAILAEQQRQYRQMLPYMLENQRQMLQRQTDMERNAILNRALNGNGGIYVPPITVTPQPVDNGNRLPTP
jgi:hypothetical protein